MKILNLFLTAATLFVLLAACTRADNGEARDENTREEARLSLRISFPETKAGSNDTAALSGEKAINSLEIFIFRASTGGDDGLLDAYKKATAAEIAAATGTDGIAMDATTGPKHIFAVANAPERLAASVTSEADLLAAISEFDENTRTSFLMVGSPGVENVLQSGNAPANRIGISLRRLVARVKVEQISGDFASPALRQKDFRVRRIFLAYAPKQAKLVNGSYEDVFGTAESFSAGGVTLPRYYRFALPSEQAEDTNGYHTPAVVGGNGQVAVTAATHAAELTAREYTPAEGMLFCSPGGSTPALPGNKMTPQLYLYMYPNGADQATVEGTADFTTKLIIETEMQGTIYYYPISLGYTQPNHAYTVNDVRITRLGSTDPNLPVTTASCSFTIQVSDWETGDIIGSFNNEKNENNFVF